MRCVFDTNVIISALLLSASLPAKALIKAETAGSVLYSEAALEEIRSVLSRPKFARYVDESDVAGFLARIARTWEEVEIISRITACRDPKDDKFLELAQNGRATHLITGDKDLLALHPFRDTLILTPAAFLAAK